MHGAAFRSLGLNIDYRAVDVAPADLAEAVARLATGPYLGANVTVPHKEAVVPLMHELTPAARAVGAVNTIVRRGDRLVGHNTDVAGFLQALTELRTPDGGAFEPATDLAGATCLLLGAGGAARAVVHALMSVGADVHVLNRHADRAGRLVEQLTVPEAPAVSGSARAVNTAQASLTGARLLVNTTSVGMSGGPQPHGVPLLDPEHLTLLPGGASVIDLVYRPAETPLLAAARRRDLATQNGLPMLVWQGALAFTEWTGVAAPVAVMRHAAERGLVGEPQ